MIVTKIAVATDGTLLSLSLFVYLFIFGVFGPENEPSSLRVLCSIYCLDGLRT